MLIGERQQIVDQERRSCCGGVPIATAQVHRPTLDDVFLNLTGRSLREDSNGKAA